MKRLIWVIIVLILLPIQVYPAQSEQVKIPKLKQLKQKELEKEIFPAESKGKWGFADEKGKFVIKPVFTQVTPFESQLSKVAVEDLWGIIRRDATYLVEPQFTVIEQFVPWNSELDIAKVVRYGRYGIISSNGDILLQPQYESVDTDIFREFGYFLVQEEGYKGIIDDRGATICDSQYEMICLVKSKEGSDDCCFLAFSAGKYCLIIPPSGSKKSEMINAGESAYVVGNKHGIQSLYDDEILEGVGICAAGNLYSISGKKYQIPPVDGIQYRNGGAIIKCEDKGLYILNKGNVMSYYEYNLAMSENAYVDDEILPEWARLYSTIAIPSKSNPVITFDDGNLQLKYESIPGRDVGGFIGGFGLTDKQGRWLVKPVLTKSQIKTTEGVRIYPCDLAGSAIVGYNGKYGRVSDRGINVPLIFNSYEEAVKYDGYKLQNSDYYVVMTEERTENGFQKYGYADNNKLVIPVQYYCYHYGDVGYLVDDISPAGFVVVNTVPSDSRKLIVINLNNEVVGPPDGVDAYAFIKELNINSMFRITEIPNRYEEIKLYDSSNLALVRKNGKSGLIDKSGREVTPCVYDYIAWSDKEGMREVEINGKRGYVNESGKEVIACVYDGASDFSCGLAAVQKGKKWGFVNKSGQEVIPCIYDYAEDFSDGFACVKKDGKFGIIKKDGQLALPLVYDFIEDLHHGVAPIKRNGKYGLFARGKEIVACSYDSYKPLHSGWGKHWAIFKNGIKGFKGSIQDYNNNHSKEILISPMTGEVYDEIERTNDAMTEVKKNGEISYISITGKKYSDCWRIRWFNDYLGYYFVKNNGKAGIADENGKEVLPCLYEVVDRFFVENYLRVKKNGKWGFVDTNWKEVLPCIYEDESSFNGDYASVKKDGKWGYIDKKGKSVLPNIYDEASAFLNGYAIVKKSGSYGVIDIMGNEAIPFIYDGIVPLMSGLFVVEKNDKYGVIDKSGNGVLPIVYDSLECKGDLGGELITEKDGKYGVIDNNGKETIPCIYDRVDVTRFRLGAAEVYDGDDTFFLSYMGKKYDYASVFEHYTIVGNDNKYGIIDNTGREIVPCIYDHIKGIYEYFEIDYYFRVRKNNKYGIINKEGIEVIPCVYDDVLQLYGGGVTVKKSSEEYFVSYRNKRYDDAEPFSADYTMVRNNNKCGFIDRMGNEIIECVYDLYYNLDEYPLALLCKEGKHYIVEPINYSLQGKLSEIHYGLTESEVIKILGAPIDRAVNVMPGRNILFYRSGDFEIVILLRDGKVFGISVPNYNI